MLTAYRLALALLAWAWFSSLPQPWPLTSDEALLQSLFAPVLFFWACRPPARLLAWATSRLAAFCLRRPEERDPWRGTRVTPRRLPG
ncbi:MAG: hypothetical protein R6W92_04065 [Desulfocurvibacter africanus]